MAILRIFGVGFGFLRKSTPNKWITVSWIFVTDCGCSDCGLPILAILLFAVTFSRSKKFGKFGRIADFLIRIRVSISLVLTILYVSDYTRDWSGLPATLNLGDLSNHQSIFYRFRSTHDIPCIQLN